MMTLIRTWRSSLSGHGYLRLYPSAWETSRLFCNSDTQAEENRLAKAPSHLCTVSFGVAQASKM
jgi:hypothetical protein